MKGNGKDRFKTGSGCYTCRVCGRKTRSIGNGDSENIGLCDGCYNDEGELNEHTDGYHAVTPSQRCPRCQQVTP